jgi:hypothetical protein
VDRPVLSIVAFLALLTAVLGGLHYYVWSRLVRAPQLPPEWQRIGAWAFFGLALLTPVGAVLGTLLPRRAGTVIAGVAYTWLGVLIVTFFLLVSSELLRVAVAAVAAVRAQPLDPERRAFLSRSIAAVTGVAAFGLTGAGAASALGEVAVRRVRVALQRFPEGLSGFRVVQLSDVHIGPTIGGEWLAEVVRRVNALAPDLVVITGDLVDGRLERLRGEVAPLAELRARHGVYFVTGNHEYYSGVDEWIPELARLGVRTLRNERVVIGEGDASFDLAGVDDWSARRHGRGHGADLARALRGRDTTRELVLLAHQPKQIHEAARAGVGLQLSGHTHGGQIFPWGYLVRLDQPYVAGLARHTEGTQIYVSRGTGYWGPPIRIGAPAEITLLELGRA